MAVLHGHYADAAEVASRLAGALNVPRVLTGHSPGRNKFERLLKQGRLSRKNINTTYKIMMLLKWWFLVLCTRLKRNLRVRWRRGVSCLGRYAKDGGEFNITLLCFINGFQHLNLLISCMCVLIGDSTRDGV